MTAQHGLRSHSDAPTSESAPSTRDTWEFIDTAAGLEEVIASVSQAPMYALDTEFHRERTYFPKLALVQIAWGDPQRIALIDPLAVDFRPFGAVIDGPGVMVLHAASQDLEVLELACATVPMNLFDTQLGAAFLGMGLPSLSELHDRVLGGTLAKGDRLTDWLRRPLGADQLRYAAADVSDLLQIHRQLSERLVERGRVAWVAAECDQLRQRVRGSRDPDAAWSRIREVRQLKGRAQNVARAVAGWRERRAARVDLPPRFVLPDLAVAAISQRAPSTEAELRKVRGIEERFLKGAAGAEVLEAVRAGIAAPQLPAVPTVRSDVPRELRAAISLLTAWVAQRARDLEIDSSLLATRGDLEDLLREDPEARLAAGWRGELIGEQIIELVKGRAALAFDGRGGLLLEPRSV